DVSRLVDPVLAATGGGSQRDAVIRHVVSFQVVVIELDPRVGAQAESERRRNAPTADVDVIAPGNVGMVLHQVQTERRGVGELLVQVSGVALGLVGAKGIATVVGVAQVSALGDQVQAAARGTGAGERRTRPFADFYRFDVEDFPALRGNV